MEMSILIRNRLSVCLQTQIQGKTISSKYAPIHQASRQDHFAKQYLKYAHDTKVRSSASDVPQSYKMAMVPYNPFWAIRGFSAAPPIVYQTIVSGRLPFSFPLFSHLELWMESNQTGNSRAKRCTY